MYGVPETETTPSAGISLLTWFLQPWLILQGLGEFLNAVKDNVLWQKREIAAQNVRIKAMEAILAEGVRDMRREFTNSLRKL